MEGWSEFLKSSTIHGLSYIPITKKHVKLLWIMIVTMSFIGAGFMIYLSFKDWAENPIKTTLKTHVILLTILTLGAGGRSECQIWTRSAALSPKMGVEAPPRSEC